MSVRSVILNKHLCKLEIVKRMMTTVSTLNHEAICKAVSDSEATRAMKNMNEAIYETVSDAEKFIDFKSSISANHIDDLIKRIKLEIKAEKFNI